MPRNTNPDELKRHRLNMNSPFRNVLHSMPSIEIAALEISARLRKTNWGSEIEKKPRLPRKVMAAGYLPPAPSALYTKFIPCAADIP